MKTIFELSYGGKKIKRMCMFKLNSIIPILVFVQNEFGTKSKLIYIYSKLNLIQDYKIKKN